MYELFSVDDHIVEPPGVWVDRVPARLRERVPHVVEIDGRQKWVWDGGEEATMGGCVGCVVGVVAIAGVGLGEFSTGTACGAIIVSGAAVTDGVTPTTG